MRACRPLALAALLLTAMPGRAQTLLHRYSFNGNAQDAVGTAHGMVVGAVSLRTAYGVNGAAVFAGGTSGTDPGYIRLPATAVSSLQNATLEVFTTGFDMPSDLYGQAGGQFQALFTMETAYGNQSNYLILSPNRAGAGIGVGARRNGVTETVTASLDPLPVWRTNHVVHLVYSGYTGLGSAGTVTLYLDGVQVAHGTTVNSPAWVASGSGGAPVVGIGGGSPFNDPTFRGSMTEFRIWDGALTPAQIAANVSAGPAVLGFTPPYTLSEAVRALSIAAGTASPTPWEAARLNLETPSPAIDALDAVRIVRKASGLDPNP